MNLIVNEFDSLLEEFKLQTGRTVDDDTTPNDSHGENIESDCFIAMDSVLGLTDKSNVLASFLIVARKFKYSCLHIISYNFSRKIYMEINSFTNKYF